MIGLIVQARSRSTRFPNKSMADLDGKPVIEHVLKRCAAAKTPELRVLAIPKGDPNEQKFIKIAAKHRFEVWAPDCEPDDVLRRFYLTAREYHIDIIARVTGDCPLIDSWIIDRCIGDFVINRISIEYLTNSFARVHPRGMDVEVFSYGALERVMHCGDPRYNLPEIADAYDREHVTPYFRRFPKLFLHRDLAVNPMMEGHDARLCVDYPEDLEFIAKVYQACKTKPHNEDHPAKQHEPHITGQYPYFGVCEIVKALKEHPEWSNINAHIRQAG